MLALSQRNVTAAAKSFGYKIFSRLLTVAGLLPMLQDASHRPFTMLWPTDSALQALPPERKNWLYHEDHRDKLAAILRGHVIRNIEVGTHRSFGPYSLHTQLQSHLHLFRPWHLTYPTWANSEPCMETPFLSPAVLPGP